MTTIDTEAPGLKPPDEGPAARVERATRKPLPLWDRVKFLILLGIIWLVLVWAAMADNPLLPFVDALPTRDNPRVDLGVEIRGTLIPADRALTGPKRARLHAVDPEAEPSLEEQTA